MEATPTTGRAFRLAKQEAGLVLDQFAAATRSARSPRALAWLRAWAAAMSECAEEDQWRVCERARVWVEAETFRGPRAPMAVLEGLAVIRELDQEQALALARINS